MCLLIDVWCIYFFNYFNIIHEITSGLIVNPDIVFWSYSLVLFWSSLCGHVLFFVWSCDLSLYVVVFLWSCVCSYSFVVCWSYGLMFAWFHDLVALHMVLWSCSLVLVVLLLLWKFQDTKYKVIVIDSKRKGKTIRPRHNKTMSLQDYKTTRSHKTTQDNTRP